MEMNTSSVTCYRCGMAYSRRKGYFPVSYAPLHKGMGYLSICKDCIETMYTQYLEQCNDQKLAVRQMCRKLDLYWNEHVYDMVSLRSTSRSIMSKYIQKISNSTYVGKSYDDTLNNEGTLWRFKLEFGSNRDTPSNTVDSEENPSETTSDNNLPSDEDILFINNDNIEITEDVVAFWGGGYTKNMYKELEQRRQYWISKLPYGIDVDIGTEALIRQICSLELDINRDRIAGKPVDKSVNALNTLLGSANLKPNQKKDDIESSLEKTPMGVWIWKLENKRPVKEVDPELEDVDGIRRYVTVWLFGHLCKMLNIKNSYSKLYEEEIARMRVERPEYDEDDDETMLYDIFGNVESVDDGD